MSNYDTPTPDWRKSQDSWMKKSPNWRRQMWDGYNLQQEMAARDAVANQGLMQSLMNAPDASQNTQAPAAPQGGLMNAPTGQGIGIGGGQVPGSILDILLKR